MMSDTHRDRGRADEVERARARLIGTLARACQQQFSSAPTLMREAWEGAKDKGADLAEDAVDAVRKRPLAATRRGRRDRHVPRPRAADGPRRQGSPTARSQKRTIGSAAARLDRKTEIQRRKSNDRQTTDQDRRRRAARIEARGSARSRLMKRARERAADTLGEAPLIALAGGIAAGALIAALLPRTEGRDRAVRPTVAERVKDTARAARRGRQGHRQRSASTSSASPARRARRRSARCFRALTDAAKASAKPRSTPRATD